MSKKRGRGISRREFVKLAGTGALAAGAGPAFLFPERAQAQQKTLKILQWSHFVPAYDTWFNGTFTKEWGQKNNTNVVVDNINLVDLGTRAASEVSAQKGHDLFMFLSPPAAYENVTIDMSHVYQEVEKKHGKENRTRAQVHLQPEDETVFRLLRCLHARSRKLAQGLVDGSGLSQRSRHVRGLAGGREKDS